MAQGQEVSIKISVLNHIRIKEVEVGEAIHKEDTTIDGEIKRVIPHRIGEVATTEEGTRVTLVIKSKMESTKTMEETIEINKMATTGRIIIAMSRGTSSTLLNVVGVSLESCKRTLMKS